MSFNQLEDISNGSLFKSLYNLFELDLSSNKLQSLGKSFLASSLNIKFINLSANGLRFLEPGVFSGLNSLETLDVSGNYIRELAAFNNLPRLVNFYLFNNSLANLSISWPEGLACLINLYISPAWLGPFESVANLIASTNANSAYRFVKRNYANVTYLKSMNTLLVSSNESELLSEERYCFNVLYMIRHMIGLNLRTGDDFREFEEKCETYSEKIFSHP
jgi:Leucine-rich repeat (LRR) protein